VNTCPRDYECAVTADGVTSVCQPAATMRSNVTSGCGRCAATATEARPLTWASLALLGLLLARRSRRHGARAAR
jgi:MYXO-CTERM domain-containing protein